ncbi:hypothetical protein HYZ64_00425 [Candidatus Berkelbacteria bacterium]|nr:hypothetical protein [Candidatus Berkelbacteria bacterium]
MNTFFTFVLGIVIGYIAGVVTSKFIKLAVGLLIIIIILGYLYLRYIAA